VSRFIKIPTNEMGELRILLIDTEPDGSWEPEWEPLRGTIFGDQFSTASREAVEHALHRLSRPLVDALGIPPEGALRRVPVEGRECFNRRTCKIYLPKHCRLEAKNMPRCFEPDGVASELVRETATKAFEYWRDRVYLVVVKP
jgi:hypothetical protein